jgi:hypothetical protein
MKNGKEELMKFVEFKKIPRLSREAIVTEKLDGSNGQIFIYNSNEELFFPFSDESGIPSKSFIQEFLIAEKDGLLMFAGSRNIWLKIGKQSDNHGFASWVKELWILYNASTMKKPTIDRFDNNGDYCFNNCKFIESSENTAKRNKDYFAKKRIKNGK